MVGSIAILFFTRNVRLPFPVENTSASFPLLKGQALPPELMRGDLSRARTDPYRVPPPCLRAGHETDHSGVSHVFSSSRKPQFGAVAAILMAQTNSS